ncbi:MAG: hypothetical protein ABSE04_00910 [Candidatus Microgenomates bacterium]|jgi:hypothetical protein
MYDLFQSVGKTFKHSFLLRATFENGKCGKIEIALVHEMEVETKGSGIRYFVRDNYEVWRGIQEPEDCNEKELDPCERHADTACLPHTMEEMDVLNTSNRSRFLSLGLTTARESYSEYVPNNPDREIAVIFENYSDLLGYLGKALTKIGVPHKDQGMILEDINSKL